MKIETGDKHCVQCGKKLEYSIFFDVAEEARVFLHFCTQADCPNYGLLALGEEDMPKEND